MAAPAETRTPNVHRAKRFAPRECGWKHGDSALVGRRAETKKGRPTNIKEDCALLRDNSTGSDMTALRLLPSFPAECWQSGPRRQGYAGAAQNPPLTAPGRSESSPLGKREPWERKKIKLDTDRPSHGRRLHSPPLLDKPNPDTRHIFRTNCARFPDEQDAVAGLSYERKRGGRQGNSPNRQLYGLAVDSRSRHTRGCIPGLAFPSDLLRAAARPYRPHSRIAQTTTCPMRSFHPLPTRDTLTHACRISSLNSGVSLRA